MDTGGVRRGMIDVEKLDFGPLGLAFMLIGFAINLSGVLGTDMTLKQRAFLILMQASFMASGAAYALSR